MTTSMHRYIGLTVLALSLAVAAPVHAQNSNATEVDGIGWTGNGWT